MPSDLQTIKMQWTHHPDYWLEELTTVETDGKTYYHSRSGEGWDFIIRFGKQIDRCGTQHPDLDPYDAWGGSCGGVSGHEHPHIWCWETWRVTEITRRSTVRVPTYS